MNCAECSEPILAVEAAVDPRTMGHAHRAQCGHPVSRDAALTLWQRGMRWTLPVVDGISLGAAERQRQVHEEGYTPEHDAGHDPGDLAWAAWALLDAAASDDPVTEAPKMWPDGWEWKPDHSPMRRLVIAEAFIAAEIDRRLMEGRTRAGG
jgi:hypothetical protein